MGSVIKGYSTIWFHRGDECTCAVWPPSVIRTVAQVWIDDIDYADVDFMQIGEVDMTKENILLTLTVMGIV